LEDFRFWIDSTDKSRGGYHMKKFVVTDNRHRRNINIRARCSQSFENLTVNRVFPVPVAEEKYPLRFHIIRIQSESVPSFFKDSRAIAKLGRANFLLV
ncbi:hypothetical protein QUA46_28715, partial [Microcoleus sp. MON2_D6]|uniref:hypothetical protein n=1 Tax=Microcoleus sp. MON2_D6 TaxID=3055377 RepID=UPI002FD6AF27